MSDACDRWKPCGHHDCKKCFPGQILPPSQRGRLKPGGGGSKKSLASKGYRVYASGDVLTNPQHPIEDFSIPDLAIQSAKRRAKQLGRHFVISRDGVQWLMVKWDGTTEELK